MWWNDQVKAAVIRKEDVWKEVLGARNADARERCLEVYKEEKRKVKRREDVNGAEGIRSERFRTRVYKDYARALDNKRET